MSNTERRVFVESLAARNNGEWHGEWMDADDTLPDEVARLLASCPYGGEEYAISDYEGFGAVKVGEFSGIDRVVKLAELIGKAEEEHQFGEAAFPAYLDNLWHNPLDDPDVDLEAEYSAFEDRYVGLHGSLADYVEEIERDSGTVKDGDRLSAYIDWESMARDAELSGDFMTIDYTPGRGVLVYWGH